MTELVRFHHVALTVTDLDRSASWYRGVLGLVELFREDGDERRADLDEWIRRLDDRDVAHSGVIDVPTGAILNCKDPDGIALAIFWDR